MKAYTINRRTVLLLFVFVSFQVFTAPGNAETQNHCPVAVQELLSHIEPGEREIFMLSNLKRGDKLYVYMERLSGNLDPLFAITDGAFMMKMFDDKLADKLKATPNSPHDVFRRLLDTFYMAWDDDSGAGTDAALKFRIPSDGSYKVVVAGSRQPVGHQVTGLTFGNYRLLVGLNDPNVLTGKAESYGPAFAELDYSPSAHPRIQEITGTLTKKDNSTYYRLAEMDPGSTLYIHAETTSGDLKPALSLRNYGNKTMKENNWKSFQNVASLKYTFQESTPKSYLVISGDQEQSTRNAGQFKILIGINAPEILQGKGQPTGSPIVSLPIQVGVGVQIDQIIEVNQQQENFGVVGDLVLRWNDPAFAFNPDTCQCALKVLEKAQFEKFVKDNHLDWPRFVFFNQQGNRWTQANLFRIFPDGSVTYYERFSVSLQAPDFDFQKFPLDTQPFFLRLQCLNPEEDYQFTDLTKKTGISKEWGEEEWYSIGYDTNISSIFSSDDGSVSQYALRFICRRHLSFYIFRIFIPLGLIISISWVSFFLEDYTKRIDISGGANLLVFIAFNFTIGSDLPKLGYLTMLDTILIVAFIITTLSVICNVVLRRLEVRGNTRIANLVNTCGLWGYLSLYLFGFLFIILEFYL